MMIVTHSQADSVSAFVAQLGEMTEEVVRRLAIDFGLAGNGPVAAAAVSRDYQVGFGRLLIAVYELGLDRLFGSEFAAMARALSAHGLAGDYSERMLAAWETAIVSRFDSAKARPFVESLRTLRGCGGGCATAEPNHRPLAAGAGRLLEFAVDGRRREAAEALLSAHVGEDAVEVAVTGLLVPALGEVGRRWEQGQFTAAQEHAVTEVLRYAALRLVDGRECAPRNGHRGLVACAPGEEHSLAAELVAGYLDLRGWDARLIGRSAPPDDILAELARHRSDVGFFSVTLVANLPALRSLVLAARGRFPRLGVVLGGRAALLAESELTGERVVVARGLTEAHDAAMRF